MNILLVDDNVYILEGLRAGIDFQALGIGKVFEAKSMQEAIGLMEKEEIPLVLTDIEMPHGTGLQFLEWINQAKPDTVTIFCTSFADFDYAKKALELHSFGYYLKPILYDELYHLLKDAMDEVLNRRQSREKERYGEYWLDSLAVRKRHFWEDALMKIYGFDRDELELLAQADHLPYSGMDCFTLALLKYDKEKSKMEGFSRKLERFVMQNIAEELLEDTAVSMEALVKCQKDVWMLVLSHAAETKREYLKRIILSVARTIGGIIQCPMNGYFAYGSSFHDIQGRYMDLEYLCRKRETGEGGILDLDDEPSREEEQEMPEDTEIAVKKVQSYIDGHFCGNIEAEVLGEITHYSSGYLNKLFKRKNGISLGTYVIDRRMELAKKLLLENRMPVSEVALEVGYDNLTYFSRLFRKKTGMSPKEYRKSKRM